MRADPKPTPSEMEGASAWLDGLTGRSGHGPEHEEGAALREALQPMESESAPSWADVELRAGLAPMGEEPPSMHSEGPRRVAANAPSWLHWLGAAAAVVLMIGVGALVLPTEPVEGLRGGSPAGQLATATWRVVDPVQSSKNLASELEALGAQVEWSADGYGAQLNISASGAVAVAAVNHRLAGLETALDVSGRLTLKVTEP